MASLSESHTENQQRVAPDLTGPALAGELDLAVGVEERRPAGERVTSGRAPWLAIVYARAGASVDPDGAPWYRPGALHLVLPGTMLPHRVSPEGLSLFYACLSGPLVDRWLQGERRLAGGAEAPVCMPRPDAAAVERLHEVAVAAPRAVPFDEWRFLAALCSLFAAMSRGLAELGVRSIRERVAEAVEANPAAEWRADDLAAALGTSRPALDSAFRRETGEPLMSFVRRKRMAFARRLLAEGLPVERVAERMGASSPFALSRAFKGVFGYPPSRVQRIGPLQV